MARDWTQDEVIKDLERVIEKQDAEIERLRKENQTQALDFLASEGEWWELIGKKTKEIEKLQEAYRLVRDSYEDTANKVARLRKRDGFINKLDEQIVTKDAEIEKLREDRSRLREALQELVDWQNGPPLATYTYGWNKAMEKALAALNEGK